MFEWDARKRKANLAKHGLDFKDVKHFDFDAALTRIGDRFDYGEVRYQSLGFIGSQRVMLSLRRSASPYPCHQSAKRQGQGGPNLCDSQK